MNGYLLHCACRYRRQNYSELLVSDGFDPLQGHIKAGCTSMWIAKG